MNDFRLTDVLVELAELVYLLYLDTPRSQAAEEVVRKLKVIRSARQRLVPRDKE